MVPEGKSPRESEGVRRAKISSLGKSSVPRRECLSFVGKTLLFPYDPDTHLTGRLAENAYNNVMPYIVVDFLSLLAATYKLAIPQYLKMM